MIKIVNLNKTFHHNGIQVPAVHDLNLNIESSEIVCLFGRSGSGKTTLLNLVGTLYRPDSGEIIYDDKNVNNIPSSKLPQFRRRNIGFVFQHFNLIPYLTAVENVELPLKFDGVSSADRKKKAIDLLEKLGLSHRLNFKLSGLSGGQIQRVAFARSVIMNPAVVLADEPTGQLDSSTAGELAEMIVEMNKNLKTSFLIATHDSIISQIAHRTVYMEDGKIVREKVNNEKTLNKS